MGKEDTYILDIGSFSIKSGFLSEEFNEPSQITPSYLMQDFKTSETKEVGEITYDDPKLVVREVIPNGVIANRTSILSLFKKIFENENLENLNGKSIIVSDYVNRPISQKKLITDLIMNTFGAERICFENSCILALSYYGKTSGCVVEVGHSTTQIVNVYNGYKLKDGNLFANFGSNYVGKYLQMLCDKNGYVFEPSLSRMVNQQIKETLCKVVDKKTSEMLKLINSTGVTENLQFTLPDGEDMELGNEIYLANEIFFDSSIFSSDFKGLQNMIDQSLNLINVDLRKKLSNNICLTGGAFNTEGIEGRLNQELNMIFPKRAKVEVFGSNGLYEYIPWIGANIMALSNPDVFKWVTKADYDEKGVDCLCEYI